MINILIYIIQGNNLIPNNIKEECKEKFNKNCYFNFNGVTKIGKLIGIELNLKLNELFYILSDLESKDKYYITCIDTTLKRLWNIDYLFVNVIM